MLDADARAVLDLVEASGRPPLHTLSVEEARAAVRASLDALGKPPPPVGEQDIFADGPLGAVPLKLYRPLHAPEDVPLPVMVYFHGGGWMTGDLAYGAWFCASLADQAGIVVVSVDYRLAPEYPFPAGLEDCVAALCHVRREAAALAIDGTRIAVGGDSAGGNLAAVCALWARDEGLPLSAQILLYPVTDLMEEHESYRRNADGFGLTADAMRWFRDAYRNGADATDWRLSPLRARRLKGVAPALVLTCGFDPLCAEGDAYADRLVGAGVPVNRIRYTDQIHGFVLWAKRVRAAEQALTQIMEELRARLFA
ncbi:alpha/beta hydrolase fold-3 domain protein [Sphingobium chlorophenolicum L-1]|uniref:Alpha/beta hydrolase fold-3 domain protein n=1 Tax=Sphingobium chlorophenolicum L-1 TaxID=690566 RepID=F6F255_SPHCR|nr:alpha/beta hydrolase [Sphingobium chlorophenolicum]AEG50555.1 alpha/beta hydrolase fold-3 domain protein [Sphingobium chlorophenolicum L-1]